VKRIEDSARSSRLDRFLAQAGVVSRRRAQDDIKKGLVRVNGLPVDEPGRRIRPGSDKIFYEDRQVEPGRERYYIILNKPMGYLSTCCDTHGRKTIFDIVKVGNARLYPIGRLDRDTKGLLLLTNDGDLTYRAAHPKYELKKVYRVKIDGYPPDKDIDKLKKGVVVDGKKTSPAKIVKKSQNAAGGIYEIEIHEGKKRQIRRMFELIGFRVKELERVAYGNLEIKGLKSAQWRYLTKKEKKDLFGLLKIF